MRLLGDQDDMTGRLPCRLIRGAALVVPRNASALRPQPYRKMIMSDIKLKVIETWDEAAVMPSLMAIAVKYQSIVAAVEDGEVAEAPPQPTPSVEEAPLVKED